MFLFVFQLWLVFWVGECEGKKEGYSRCRTCSRKTDFCDKSLSLVINILPYLFNLDFPVTGTVLGIIFDQCNTREKEVGRETVCVI